MANNTSNIKVGVRIRPLLKTEHSEDITYDNHRSVK